MLVLPEVKDTVLRKLVEDYEVGSNIEFYTENNPFSLDKGLFIAIINQFKDYSFFENYKITASKKVIFLSMNLHAHDFLRRGGFIGEEILFKDNIEKLYNELEKIQRENIETLSPKAKISIGNTIQIIASLFEIKNSLIP